MSNLLGIGGSNEVINYSKLLVKPPQPRSILFKKCLISASVTLISVNSVSYLITSLILSCNELHEIRNFIHIRNISFFCDAFSDNFLAKLHCFAVHLTTRVLAKYTTHELNLKQKILEFN